MALDHTEGRAPSGRRALLGACWAHAIHDGLTDLIYVLLPVWQTQFAISYAFVGVMRALYSGTMAGLQLSASRLSRRFGRKPLLVGGMALAGLAYVIAGLSGGLAGLCVALILGGMGASTQHPLASALVANTHEGADAKRALATYNFAGDIGKMVFPAGVGLALAWLSWGQSALLVGALALFASLALARWLPAEASGPDGVGRQAAPSAAPGRFSPGFWALLAAGFIDSATRMGFLTLLPFLCRENGAKTATIGLAMALVFLGGGFGKLVCGHLGIRWGTVKTVWFTETFTAVGILCVLSLPLAPGLAVLPLVGLMLNGTSSVLYGSVPDLIDAPGREKAFALFYSGTIGGGALSPLLFGWLSDHAGLHLALAAVSATVLLTLPLIWASRRYGGFSAA
ncbi:MFS transporter [Paludibacterium paludis]|uniref:MFS transporter n=1 Tax=Paludibacterium paludis TaxID=1225769 RepID=A0A918P235_9NEIS|nr:MFS transporter [Paludibacterium paludis]GGY14858.1 MFS transporter [Paludibacterium paludis]